MPSYLIFSFPYWVAIPAGALGFTVWLIIIIIIIILILLLLLLIIITVQLFTLGLFFMWWKWWRCGDVQLYRAECYFVGNFLLILRLLFIFISFILFYTTSKSVICYGFPFILLKISLKKIYVVCARGPEWINWVSIISYGKIRFSLRRFQLTNHTLEWIIFVTWGSTVRVWRGRCLSCFLLL